jgi:hypothetical protein
MKSNDFEILRHIKASFATKELVARKPIRVATLIDEQKFIESGNEWIHNKTLFLEDKVHDWDWIDGVLQYYSHAVGVGEYADVVVSYEALHE